MGFKEDVQGRIAWDRERNKNKQPIVVEPLTVTQEEIDAEVQEWSKKVDLTKYTTVKMSFSGRCIIRGCGKQAIKANNFMYPFCDEHFAKIKTIQQPVQQESIDEEPDW